MADRLSLRRAPDGGLVLALAGRWLLGAPAPDPREVIRELEDRAPGYLSFEVGELEAWDSRLVAFAADVIDAAGARDVRVDRRGLPSGVQRLLALSEAPSLRAPEPAPVPRGWARAAAFASAYASRLGDVLRFIGETAAAAARLAGGRARIRGSDVWLQMRTGGAQALPIVALVSFLVGLILAFVSAVRLEDFGATRFVADLVGIAVVRELGAIMAAVVIAGRTGAAFAAELGTMRVTEEIDALNTLGISSYEFLVLPRAVALTAMLPALTIFADAIGVLGGAAIGIGVLDLAPRAYYSQAVAALAPADVIVGLIKATVYGALVAGAGCFEGLRCRRTAAGVGRAATAAVVDGIVLVIAASGVFSVIFYVVGV